MFLMIRKETYKAGDVIFHEGSHGVAVYVVSSGKVEISKIIQGHRVVVEVFGPGEMFGEMSFIDSSPRSATATALEDTVLDLLDKDFMDREFNQISSDFRVILTNLVRRLRKTTRGLLYIPRRKEERIAANIRISFKSMGDFFKAYIGNVGTGGLFIKASYKTVENLPVGSLLNLEFNLPDSSHVISTKGKVIWVRSQDEVDQKKPPGMGIQFVDMKPEDTALVKAYIDRFR